MITETVQRIVDVSSEDFRAAAKKEQQLRYNGLNQLKVLKFDYMNICIVT